MPQAKSRTLAADSPPRPRAGFIEPLEQRLLMRALGVDVSQYQGSMNFGTAWNQGAQFALIRASRTDIGQDTKVTTFVPAAKNQGLTVGVYHRALPFSNLADNGAFRDPVVDADSFIAAGGAYMGTGYMRPILDIENGTSLRDNPVNGYNLSSWVVAFINRIKQVKGVEPLVYANGNFARNYLNSTVKTAAPDLWIARWNSPFPNAHTDQPQQVSSWPNIYGHWNLNGYDGPPHPLSWKFWQYSATGNGLGSTWGAGSVDIDLDVFNGDDPADPSNPGADGVFDINWLKQNFVIGAADVPTGPSPAQGAANVNPVGVTLNWNDSPGAVAYDLFLDDVKVATNLTASQWTHGSTLPQGAHTWRVVAKGVLTDDDTYVTGPTWTFNAAAPAPGSFVNQTPANNAILTASSVSLNWSDAPNATSYDVYLDGSGTAVNVPSSNYGPFSPGDGAHTWRVVAKNAAGTSAGSTWSYTVDTVAPAASFGGESPAVGEAFFDFTVTYTDATTGVDVASLDDGDLRLTGPNEFDQPATLVSVDNSGNGSPRVATYRVAAPGGSWDAADNGSYTLTLQPNQVRDIAGLWSGPGAVGTLTANLTPPFAYKVGSTLNVQFDGTTVPISLAAGADGTVSATRDGVTLPFTGVTDVLVLGSPDADALLLDATAPLPPLMFDNGYGADRVTITAGSYHFASDLGGDGLSNVEIIVDPGAVALFDTVQHLRRLTLNAGASAVAGDTLVVNELSINAGLLDLGDNDLIIDYSDTSPVGIWDGATYTGITGLVRDARNGGAWNGATGIKTSAAAGFGNRYTLGVAEASRVLRLAAGETGTFSDQVVDATSVLVKFTYGGDATLDGVVNVDDYGAIDSNASRSGVAFGFFNGDFNYDGSINVDDYGIIDSAVNNQGLPL